MRGAQAGACRRLAQRQQVVREGGLEAGLDTGPSIGRPHLVHPRAKLQLSLGSSENPQMPQTSAAASAMDWDTYVDKVTKAYDDLLATQPLPEARLQRFLEQHPAMVPFPMGFAGGSGGVRGHHGSLHSALFTQPQLPGIERPVPDFMRILRDSGGIHPVLIEIEAPNRRVVNKDGYANAHFTHALGQLAEWRDWFEDSTHQQAFRELYRIPNRWVFRRINPQFLLVYGRRAELDAPQVLAPKVLAQRDGLLPANTGVMSFDRLAPSLAGRREITVRVSGRRFQAVAISPTLEVGPRNAEDLVAIDGKVPALRRSAMLTPRRRELLSERLPYWDSWIGSRPLIKAAGWE